MWPWLRSKLHLYLLLVFIPIALILEALHHAPLLVFLSSALAIIPLAGLMGEATEHLASRVGAGLGALLNASLGNAAELIIALVALREGLQEVVKASLTGSIIGNILLVLGVSMIAGGITHRTQRFNRVAAGMNASLLLLAAVGLIVPALFHATVTVTVPGVELDLSLEIACVLFGIYLLSLVFSLLTHRDLLFPTEGEQKSGGVPTWSRAKATGVLATVTVGLAAMSELLVGAIEPVGAQLGLTQVFLGVILVALVGNAAEHSTAVVVAMRNKMDLALGIAVGSSLQIALFVAPILVFASYALGKPMNLIFTQFEVAAVSLSVLIVGFIAMDGESHWMEGVMLVGVYLILAIAFYFLPA